MPNYFSDKELVVKSPGALRQPGGRAPVVKIGADGIIQQAIDWKNDVIAAGGTVSPGRLNLVSDTMSMLLDANVFQSMDVFQVFAAENIISASIDWKRYRNPIGVNSPTFVVDDGINGNGSTSYVDTNYNPNIRVNLEINEAVLGIYAPNLLINQYTGSIDNYLRTTTAPTTSIDSRISGAGVSQTFNYPSAGSAVNVAYQITGGFTEAYMNGVRQSRVTAGSTSGSGLNLFLGGLNDGFLNVPNSFRYGIFYMGKSLNQSQHLALNNAIDYYISRL